MYLDETVIKPEHPVHEYTHLWDKAVMEKNPKLWKRGVQLMQKGATSLWNEIADDENYGKLWRAKGIKGEELANLIASEVHSKLVGPQGAEILDRLAKEKGKEDIFSKLKQWILDFWKDLRATSGGWRKGATIFAAYTPIERRMLFDYKIYFLDAYRLRERLLSPTMRSEGVETGAVSAC